MTIAIVTGGASGMGLATSERFARDGYAVAVWDVNDEAAADAASSLRDTGAKAAAIHADVASLDSVAEALAQTVDALGHPTVLVNCAGIRDLIPFFDLTPEDWFRVVNVDLTGPFYCSQVVARDMVDNGIQGAIVNIISIAAYTSFPDRTAYIAAKTGLLGLNRSLAQSLGPHGIRVNGIAPGVIKTPMHESAKDRPEMIAQIAAIPLGRAGDPSEIASAVAFLAGPDASFVNGEMLVVDGGTMASG